MATKSDIGLVPASSDADDSLQRLEPFLRQMPIGVIVADATGRLLFANEIAEQIFAEPFEALRDRWQRGAIARYRRPDGTRYTRAEWPLTRAVTLGEVVTGEEIEIETAEGALVAVEISAGPVRRADGTIVAGVVSLHDVTERRLYEAHDRVLSEVTQLLAGWTEGVRPALDELPRLLVPAIADCCALYLAEDEGVLRPLGVADSFSASPAHREALRGAAPLAADHPASEVARKRQSALFVDPADELLARLAPQAEELVRELEVGSWLGVPLVGRDGVVAVLTGFTTGSRPRLGSAEVRLFTEVARRAALALDNAVLLASLGTERDRLRRLLERLDEGVVALDRSLTVRFANAAAARALGRSVTEGERLPEHVGTFDLIAFATALFARNATATHEDVDLGARKLRVAGIPASGSDLAMILSADVSTEERRERAEREFVTNAAHELQTPLAAIISAIEVLQGGAKDEPAERDRFLRHIERESDRLAHLTRALLTLARTQAHGETPRSPVRIRPLLERVAALARPHDGVRVEVACPAAMTVHANEDLLEQALLNLATNAAKFTSEGRIVFRGERRDDRVVIEVADTGPGVPDRDRVFDRFYRGNPGEVTGFGLGLSIVQEAVHALDGDIELVDTPGGGTTARITLPEPADRR